MPGTLSDSLRPMEPCDNTLPRTVLRRFSRVLCRRLPWAHSEGHPHRVGTSTASDSLVNFGDLRRNSGWETGGMLFREHCVGRENSLSSAANSVSSAKNSVSSLGHTHIIGGAQ